MGGGGGAGGGVRPKQCDDKKKVWVSLEFSFYHFPCSLEGIQLRLTINITLGRNDQTKYVL